MAGRDATLARLMTLGTCVLPRTRARLTRLITDGTASLNIISDELVRDPLLTASVLGRANLAANQPVLQPTQALLSLGFATIEQLLSEAAEVPEPQRRPMATCWAMGNATAVLMRTIADYRATRLPKRPDDEVLSAIGMLHDLGTAVALLHFTPAYARASLQARSGNAAFQAALAGELGMDSCELGGELARSWNLPEPLATIMAWHAKPMQAPEHLELTALTHVARGLARALGFQPPGDAWVTPIDLTAVQVLGLGATDLERILNRILDDIDEMELFESMMLKS
jgi:HD-like signal output (HDOD) protein